ncbi:putative hydroxyacylglutathione hydrolase [Leptospira ryugenii]|uniref:hydroxyacylglutathione hydrolase n=1 Tax=Leptospira ryugenii TaxID=1917863 RepID=A0A2P2DWF0_9LEPT|nr:hydroxyacylglutathione hydrolase family protein [Leptospira ryugenii]GBF48946.1 putative hydroxyacylglutathione hydrolase [Leptospira ryugenii]
MVSVLPIYTHSPLRNYSYLIIDKKDKRAVCIDPFSAPQILEILHTFELRLELILNTHEHKDHTAGNAELKKETGAIVKAHVGGLGIIPEMDEAIQDGETVFSSGHFQLRSLETPGHTFCHHCFLLEQTNEKVGLFSGDTVFNAGVGNCYRGGDAKVLYRTLREKLHSLPNDLILYPGHDYWENNLRFAKQVNPNASLDAVSQVVAKEHSSDSPYLSRWKLEKEINPFFQLQQVKVSSPNLFTETREPDVSEEENLFLQLRSVRDKW